MPNSERQYRQSIRLPNYDYSSSGAYFVTIVTQDRACLFGSIQQDKMSHSPAGEMLQSVWQTLPTRFPTVELDSFVVMPNHIHGIVILAVASLADSRLESPASEYVGEEQSVPTRGTPTEMPTLGTIIGAWKSLTTVEYISGVKTRSWSPFMGRLWQRNYYEHVVRGQDDLVRIRDYIETNPAQWMDDAENPHKPRA